MAVVERRGPAQYRVRIRLRGERVSRTFATREAAESWARETERQIRDGVYQQVKAAEAVTLAAALDRYLETVTPRKRPGAAERERVIAGHVKDLPDLAGLPLPRVRPSHIASYRDARLQQVAPGTVNRELVLLGHLFEVAAREWGFEDLENPARKVPKARVRNARDRRLRPGEWRQLYRGMREGRSSRTLWLRPFVRLLLETAMRRGDLLSVRWRDVDLERRVITLHAENTKTGRGRSVPLSSRAVRVLQVWRRLSGDGDPPADSRVFPVTANAVRLAWVRACRRAGIADLRMHDLRHEATSRLFERGLDVMQVASITGHSDPRMLARYTHLRAEDLLDKLG